MAFVCHCIKHLNPPCLVAVFIQSRGYQTSVTLPATDPIAPLWTRIVLALATWMSMVRVREMATMWVPVVLLSPWVMAAGDPLYDSKPTHSMPALGICNKLA